MIKYIPEVVEVIQEEKVVFELSSEQAALICFMVFQTGGAPETTLRGVADEIMDMFYSIDVIGYDTNDNGYKDLCSKWEDGYFTAGREHPYFQKLVAQIKNSK